jgi:DNA-binding HxlR family transcriptional regulator
MTHRAELEASRKSYNHPCLIAQTLDVIGDRWTLLVLRDLMSGLHRYGDILESCAGMSPNVLSDRLKRLEADSLVHRLYQKGLPPKVEYTLTEKGWAVRPILLAMLGWGRTYTTAITPESVGTDVSTDFAVRTLPTFSFHPERAADLTASMVVEVSNCEGCSAWTFEIHDGHLHPHRFAIETADVVLKTDSAGFFRFIRGEATPSACGDLTGPASLASAIQDCFQAS